ncbi:MAG TPA: CAP domain-containing protein [Chloroflexia bacterium]|nr:CAP domain-containing protein [Chloroflexia bacterium]
MRQTQLSKFNPIFAIVLLISLTVATVGSPLKASAAGFADNAFQRIWQQADGPVAGGQATRSWLWGAGPSWSGTEKYADAKGGQRLVQYFDKSRMEINDPSGDRNSQWFVSNGLLTIELVSGRLQTGNNQYEQRSPANIPVAGDSSNNNGPTYSSLSRLTITANNFAANRTGQPVRDYVNGAGDVGSTNPPASTTYAYYEPATRHNVPGVFWNWMQNIPGSSWVFALGYPISDAYWSQFTVGGQQKMVLVQLFQRRILTYTPSNTPAWQVEMGNIGQHYYAWRYGNTPMVPASAPAPTGSSVQLDNEEQSFIGLINDYRHAHGLGSLTIQPLLVQTARWMVHDMGVKNYFSHTDSMGRDPFKRMNDFGFNGSWMGENLAAGRGTAAEVLEQWKNSPGHNALMLKPEFKLMGIARYNQPGSTYGWYWALEFGTP